MGAITVLRDRKWPEKSRAEIDSIRIMPFERRRKQRVVIGDRSDRNKASSSPTHMTSGLTSLA